MSLDEDPRRRHDGSDASAGGAGFLGRRGLDPERTLMVGDRLDTDISFGAVRPSSVPLSRASPIRHSK